ncbi:MAG: prolyl oligopeptidase family serine peptidase [Deltaproteobacteria bacterium]|nr:prolyl oligopeptidase family serine peptidase [Deltaproteobacteria bacterium]
MTWPALDAKLLADAAATFNWKLGHPAPVAIAPDGAVLFRRTPARAFASDLFELAPDGTVRTLATVDELIGGAEEKLSDAEKARRERSRTATRGVVDADVSDDGSLVLVPLGGAFHLIDRTLTRDRATAARRVIDPGGPAFMPRLSPDGQHVAFVRDGDLWVAPTAAGGGPPRRLTHHPEGVEYGVPEHVAGESFGRHRGYWWSPDGKAIAFQRTDLRPVETLYVSDPRHPEKPAVPFKYPRSGTPNAVVDLGVIAVDRPGDPRWLTWDVKKYEYLVAVTWTKASPLSAVVVNRDQTEALLLAFDVATGVPRTLLVERDEAWVNVEPNMPTWLEDGSGFLWMTERRGAWTLELHDGNGALVRELTTPELGLRGLDGIDGTDAIVDASPDPIRRDVYRVPLAGGAPSKISTAEGVNHVLRMKHGTIVVETLARTGGRRTFALVGGAPHDLPAVAEQPSLAPTTAIETVDVGGRAQHVAITRPRAYVAGQRYPVLLKVYGGPHATTVLDARDTYVMDQWYADAGFIVIRTDGRGTPNHGRAWERAILKDLITVPLADQVAALQAIGARHRELDLGRVGVFGWSFGGYVATLAVLMRPDVFTCAVAGAPVTDWSFYDSGYTERYMKTPHQNPAGYQATSALTYADKLARPLLVIHGITDDNVHFAHTLALIESLYVAGKRAEVITLSATHMVPDPRLALAREQVQVDFFRQHLAPK